MRDGTWFDFLIQMKSNQFGDLIQVEEGCGLTTIEEIAAAVHHMLSLIEALTPAHSQWEFLWSRDHLSFLHVRRISNIPLCDFMGLHLLLIGLPLFFFSMGQVHVRPIIQTLLLMAYQINGSHSLVIVIPLWDLDSTCDIVYLKYDK